MLAEIFWLHLQIFKWDRTQNLANYGGLNKQGPKTIQNNSIYVPSLKKLTIPTKILQKNDERKNFKVNNNNFIE